MDINLDWFSILVLFGALQGLILAILLFFNKRHPGAPFLGALILILSYNSFETLNWSAGLDRYIDFFELFSFILIFGLGPSLYLYVDGLLHPEKPVSFRGILRHYWIVIFQFAWRMVIVAGYLAWKIYGAELELFSVMTGILWIYAEPLSVLWFLTYLVFTVRLYMRTEKNARQLLTVTSRKWLRSLLTGMVALGVVWSATVIVPYFTNESPGIYYYPVEIGLVFFLYWIAIVGYHRTQLISKVASPYSLRKGDAESYLEQLQAGMAHDRWYLDSELTVTKLSKLTGISSRVISSSLNQHLKKSFNDFVNEYRVQEVKQRLISPTNKHLTISGIALDCGFNSQATFQRSFKRITGHAPSYFAKKRPNDSGNATQIRI